VCIHSLGRKRKEKCSAAEVIDEPENQAEGGAEDKAGNNRKVERGVVGFVGDVAGKFAEAKRELSTEVEKGADENQDAAEDEKRTTDVAKVHRKEFTKLEGKVEER